MTAPNDRICAVLGCGRPHDALAYCVAHYRRLKRGRPLSAPFAATRHRGVRPPCRTPGCSRPMHALGLCLPEYLRARRAGVVGS